MSWREGCAPRPPVEVGAEAVPFDFTAADAVGRRLEALRRALVADRAARADAAPLLDGWAGPHRAAHDERRAAHEGVLGHHQVEVELARLRAAWEEAARAQRRANDRAGPWAAAGPLRFTGPGRSAPG